MNFVHRYFGESQAGAVGDKASLAFAADASRPPAFFDGWVRRPVAFREAISALHHVVVSDLRFKPRDLSVYKAWLAEQEAAMLADAAARGDALKARMAPLKEELAALAKRDAKLRKPFDEARQNYFDWLYRQDRDAWIVLDPVVSVHPDEISFEAFSLDESSYGRLACDHDEFETSRAPTFGVTNVDYSQALYDAFQRLRSYRQTRLTVDPSGVEAATDGAAWREEKIDLPDSWTRGFLQVSCAMGLPGAAFTLQPMDMANILARLKRRREKAGPRALRFQLAPGRPVRVIFEPWGDALECPRAIYQGAEAQEIRIWGRRRLALLARALPLAREVRVRLLGTGLPSFFTVDFGGLRFTLGLSGWTANDWTTAGRFDLLAPRHDVAPQEAERVFAALSRVWVADEASLARETGLPGADVAAAMTRYAQAGRALYDVDKGVWRRRELTAQPLPYERLRFAGPQDEAAERFVQAGLVTIVSDAPREGGGREIEARALDDGRDVACALTLDGDERIVGGRCACAYFLTHKLTKGPCAHLLATRRMAQETQGRRAAPWRAA